MLARGSTKTSKEFFKRFQEEVIKTHPPFPGYIEELRKANTTNSLQIWFKTFEEKKETRDIDHLAFSTIMLGLSASILKYPKFL